VGGVGVNVKGIGSVRISVRLASCQLIRRTIYAMYTPDMSSRSAKRIGRLLSVTCMHSHDGCEFVFPTDSDTGLLVVPTGMGVLEPSGNGLYLLPHQPQLPSSPSVKKARDPCSRVAVVAQCDLVLWHRRFGHLYMQSLQAQHTHGVPTSPCKKCFLRLMLTPQSQCCTTQHRCLRKTLPPSSQLVL
jgi:hypothetical protein